MGNTISKMWSYDTEEEQGRYATSTVPLFHGPPNLKVNNESTSQQTTSDLTNFPTPPPTQPMANPCSQSLNESTTYPAPLAQPSKNTPPFHPRCPCSSPTIYEPSRDNETGPSRSLPLLGRTQCTVPKLQMTTPDASSASLPKRIEQARVMSCAIINTHDGAATDETNEDNELVDTKGHPCKSHSEYPREIRSPFDFRSVSEQLLDNKYKCNKSAHQTVDAVSYYGQGLYTNDHLDQLTPLNFDVNADEHDLEPPMNANVSFLELIAMSSDEDEEPPCDYLRSILDEERASEEELQMMIRETLPIVDSTEYLQTSGNFQGGLHTHYNARMANGGGELQGAESRSVYWYQYNHMLDLETEHNTEHNN